MTSRRRVEAASTLDVVAIRDSQDPNGPKLLIDRTSFGRFTNS
ncbi:DUF397 domain-containing protein [Spirillospora sp. NPDC050679]